MIHIYTIHIWINIVEIIIIPIIKKETPKLECHISTQLSSMNSSAVKVLRQFGADRIVLAREASMDQIELIASKTNTPL